jgi:hypothetical protein
LYGEEVYKESEKDELFNARVRLKKEGKEGVVVSLYLPKNKEKYRENDLWYVKWDNNFIGIIERKDVEII